MSEKVANPPRAEKHITVTPGAEAIIDEQTAIQNELTEWKQYCSDWADSYRRAAQSTLTWNSWLVVAAVITSSLVAAFGSTASLPELWFLGYVSAALGVATATISGLQKSSLASTEQAKQYHSTAAAYESAKRDIESVLTSTDVEDLKKQRDAVKIQLNATDAQAPELAKNYKRRGPE
jgi:hypothetical protein